MIMRCLGLIIMLIIATELFAADANYSTDLCENNHLDIPLPASEYVASNLIIANSVKRRKNAVVFFTDSSLTYPVCSGTLITSKYILSARHCDNIGESIDKAVFLFDDSNDFFWETAGNGAYYSPVTAYDVKLVEKGTSSSGFQGDYSVWEIVDGDPVNELSISPTPMRAYMPMTGNIVFNIAHQKYEGHYDGDCDQANHCRPRSVVDGQVQVPDFSHPTEGMTTTLCGQSGASGSGVLDAQGNLLGVTMKLDVMGGIKSMWLQEFMHRSKALREIRSNRNGASIKLTGNPTANATIGLSCGTRVGESCSITSVNSDRADEMEVFGCAIDCPRNVPITVSCSVNGDSRSRREVESISWKETKPVMEGNESKGWAYTNIQYSTHCSSDTCSTTATPTTWSRVECKFTD